MLRKSRGGVLATKVGYFGVKSTKVYRVQMGTKLPRSLTPARGIDSRLRTHAHPAFLSFYPCSQSLSYCALTTADFARGLGEGGLGGGDGGGVGSRPV